MAEDWKRLPDDDRDWYASFNGRVYWLMASALYEGHYHTISYEGSVDLLLNDGMPDDLLLRQDFICRPFELAKAQAMTIDNEL